MAVTLFEEFVLLFQMACVIFLFSYLFAKSRFYTGILTGRITPAMQVFLAIAFGLLSVYGMSSGLSFYTATVNIRDFGPLAAGLACGPYIGIGAGIIGFTYRVAIGGTNVYAVAIGPLAAGIIGGLVWYYRKRELVPLRTAVVITFVAESLISSLAIIVRIVAGDPYAVWMTVAVNVAIPMIIMTTLAVALFCFILHNEKYERQVQEEKKHLELEVESKRNLSTVINTIAYPVYVVDRDHRFTLVNDRLCELAGRTRDEILGNTPDDVLGSGNSRAYGELAENVFRTRLPREEETEQRLRDGENHTLFTTSALYTDATGHEFMVGVIQDITERKKLQLAREASEAWYRTLFEHTGAATIIIEEDGTIGQVNSEFVQLTGYSRVETEGIMKWKQIAHPDELDLVRKYHRGRLIDPASVPGHYTVRMVNRNGETRTLHAVVALIPGTTRSIASYVDISEQKRSEEALTLANRKLNLLSSITRHDIINQLLILKGYLELIRKKCEDPVFLDYLDRGCRAAASIEHQITFTRDYQDMGIKAPSWQNVKATIVDAKGALPVGSVTVDTGEGDLEVFADPLFEKVFYNLIDNSLKYGGKQLSRIRVSWQDTGNGLSITYEDDGTGISGADRPNLFEQGFGRHSGFGLFLSREILSITGISIEENGVPGTCARFTMRVPPGMFRFSRSMR